ncbi:MAG: inositol monophosphatase family protein [Candidatus Bathyarchaeia archaeon]
MSSKKSTDWIPLFQAIAKEIRNSARPLIGTPRAKEVTGLGAGGDVTRRIDALAEEIIIRNLRESGTPCILISEECGSMRIGESPSEYVVVDSVDGTTNATHNIPFYATSLASADGPRLRSIKAGLVMDLHHGTTFSAERGKGAFSEGKRRLRPSRVGRVEEALIALDFNAPRDPTFIHRLVPLLERGRKFRHFGANALEVCYVASGAIDAFVDIRGWLRVTDMAAAYLVLREAGGVVVTPEGDELDGRLRTEERLSFVAASNPRLCGEILRLLS